MDRNIAFLCKDVARLFVKRFGERSRALGSTGDQWRTLLTLKRAPGISQGTLADMLEVEPITSCRMVDRLEQAGMVERKRDPSDRRAWQLFLTQAAEPVVDQMRAISTSMLGAATTGLTDDEIGQLHSLLEKVRQNLISMENDEMAREVKHG
jgi:DNA-binding MarR family transcriptional regulator